MRSNCRLASKDWAATNNFEVIKVEGDKGYFGAIKTFGDYSTCAMSTSGDMTLPMAALGIAGEAGEVADHIKKHIGHGHPLDRQAVAKELGDVLWYVAAMADLLGTPLEQIAQMNLDKLRARYPEGFSYEASINRKS